MKMRVKEVADLVGISVRTLHHYDEIGLLTPGETTESGYRLYSNEDLEMLQQILFFKELGFPLKKIKEIINNPSFNREEALMLHRKMLVEKRSRLDKVIATIDKTIQHTKGEIQMTNKEKFEGFDFSHNPYEQEARERWGIKQSTRRIKKQRICRKRHKKNLMQFIGSLQLFAMVHLNQKNLKKQFKNGMTIYKTLGVFTGCIQRIRSNVCR